MQKRDLDLKQLQTLFFDGDKATRGDISGILKEKIQKLGNIIGKIKVDFSELNGEQIWQLMGNRLDRRLKRCQNFVENFEENDDIVENQDSNYVPETGIEKFSLLKKRAHPENDEDIEHDDEVNSFGFAAYNQAEEDFGVRKKLKAGKYHVEGVDDEIRKDLDDKEKMEEEARIELEMQDYFDQLEEKEMQANVDGDDLAEGEIDEDDYLVGDNEEEGLNFDHLKGDFDVKGIDDEEYQKLLKETEEVGEEAQEEEEGEQEEGEQLDSDQEYEVEDGVFADMREKEMQIENQEQKLLDRKPWQMKGEVRAKDRPKNALLDVEVEFTHGVESKEKKAPEVHQSIDEMIKSRILTEAFDDPRKVIINYDLQDQNDADLNFQKDKNSIANYYEEEYKRKMLGLPLESKEDKIKSEILELFKEVNMHLDYMTNMTYTPMPIHASSKIQDPAKDIKVIQLEEKTPITFKSFDSVNAKQKFQARQAEFLGEEEKTHDDNRRIRRIAKRRMRAKIKKTRMKDLQEKLDYKGQSKFEYNLVNKGKKLVEREHENSQAGMVNMTKSSQFFKMLQERKDKKKEKDYVQELQDKKKLQKKVKL